MFIRRQSTILELINLAFIRIRPDTGVWQRRIYVPRTDPSDITNVVVSQGHKEIVRQTSFYTDLHHR